MKNFTSLFKESFEVYKQKLKPILILSFIYVLVFCAITVVIVGVLYSRQSILAGETLSETSLLLLSVFLKSLIFIIILFLLGGFMGASLLVLVVKPVGTSLNEIFREAWKNLWEYLIIMILAGFFIFLAYLFFFIPGVIVSVYLMFSFVVLIDEGKKKMDALKRSWNLVKGNWWKVFGKIILLNIVFLIIFFVFNSINNLLGTIVQFLSLPFGVIFVYLLYLELKKSKETQPQVSTQT